MSNMVYQFESQHDSPNEAPAELYIFVAKGIRHWNMVFHPVPRCPKPGVGECIHSESRQDLLKITTGECRSLNRDGDAEVIIVGTVVAGSALDHSLGKIC
ncbi:putative squalene monooxygenase [Sesbania bispinosa]|nr:putative squalene monooxygenase [Sesbania bispinosa]